MPKILEPIKVGKFTLKNRLMYLAMAKRLSTEDYFVTDRQIAYYENLAKGGVAIMATGCCLTVPDYPARVGMQPGLYDDKFKPGLTKLAAAVHKHGALILSQPIHHGLTNYSCTPDEVKGPDDLTLEDIRHIQDCYVEGAIRAWECGFDGVELHLAHDYLNEEFLAPMWNHRTDQYSVFPTENAVRFTTEMIERLRARCGQDILIGIKINGIDPAEGGVTLEQCCEACEILEKAGADMISVSAGGSLTDICYMSGDGRFEEGWKVPLAAEVKKHVKIPVVATGSIRHPEFVEKALAEGKCDMIGMGRGLLADPEWANKVAEGREDEICYCMNCLQCFVVTGPGQANCAVNPRSLRESENLELRKDGNGRTVVVIGAGPAGLESAITLAHRGFKPVILEEKDRIGGMERVASLPYGKSKVAWHLGYFENMIKKLRIEVRLNTKATAETVKALAPYAVFVCSGSRQIVPASIPGIRNENVITGIELLEEYKNISGKNVLVAGAGLVGLEVADSLQRQDNRVTVIDMLPEPTGLPLYHSREVKHCKESGVNILYEHRLEEIGDTAVTVTDLKADKKVSIPAELVVLSLGVIPNKEIAEELEAICGKVYRLGDAVKGGRFIDAIQAGFDAAVALD